MENKTLPYVANSAVISTRPIIDAPPITYCLYARKSTEEDERQALSIDSQINEMIEMAKRTNLHITEIRRESHSAKASGCRPVFNQLLIDIRAGKFNGVITWAPDRLSRNAGDLGTMVDLMDQGLLREIRTHGQTFSNSPNEKFLLMILCSQAKLENDNKGINVKRGLKAKCDIGIRPGSCPLGYFNEKSNIRGRSGILLDHERAPYIRQIFEKVANDYMTGRDIYRWINYDVGLKTRNGKCIPLSAIYRILEMTFYYGDFEFPKNSGNWYKGTHEPIITKELFERARGNLIASPKRVGMKEFQFTKLITCGTCGGGVTAEEKIKRSPDGTARRYVYYHCVRKIDAECQEPFVREEEILDQLVKVMDKVDFNKKGIFEGMYNEVEKFNKLSQAIFGKTAEKQEINPNKADIRSYAKYILLEGSREEKREMLTNLKSKFILKGGKISIQQ